MLLKKIYFEWCNYCKAPNNKDLEFYLVLMLFVHWNLTCVQMHLDISASQTAYGVDFLEVKYPQRLHHAHGQLIGANRRRFASAPKCSKLYGVGKGLNPYPCGDYCTLLII